MLRMVQNIFLGPFDEEKWGKLTDINARELIMVVPLAVLTIAVGIYPKPLTEMMTATLEHLVTLMAK